MTREVHAYPTKEFFVYMITKDISLEDCTLDLLDNSIDAAWNTERTSKGKGTKNGEALFPNIGAYSAEINLNGNEFSIVDNCGGISIQNASEYAFRFGRRPDTPEEYQGAIGVYGIGMKRAVLKMGKIINIRSSTKSEAFSMSINVEKWLTDPDNWDFALQEEEPWESPGTHIIVRDLYPSVSRQFLDAVFLQGLKKFVARDYSFIINSGFGVTINSEIIAPYIYELRESESIKPLKVSYIDEEGVRVEMSAGMASLPPDDSSAEEMESSARRETEYFGWFVVCNERVVLAANRTDRTVWGDEGFTKWHFQYNGFMGIIKFTSEDPDKLPWTTTKRDVDEGNPVYRRAVYRMKEATQSWVSYTTQRKRDLEKAKSFESVATGKPVDKVSLREKMVLPIIEEPKRIKIATIQYQKPLSDVQKVRETVGKPNLPYAEVGRLTFDYYLENEYVE